jgi:Cu/Zn superoxide dismutase
MVAVSKVFALVLAVLMLSVTSLALAADSASAKLEPQNNSGESGTATLTKAGDNQTKVVLDLKGAPAGASQPVHIHKGTCANLDPKPAYPLSPVVNGKSETTVNASLDSLEKGGYAINGHKSAQEAKTYVFCGPIAGM